MKNAKLTFKWQHFIYPFAIVLSVIYIAKRGFAFGQWLFEATH